MAACSGPRHVLSYAMAAGPPHRNSAGETVDWAWKSRIWQQLHGISRILWVRVALISALSLVASLSAELLQHLIPDSLAERFTEEATLPVLQILASSMLSVATFSLGVMVSSHRTLADQSTPRIHQILVADSSTQTILATFIGAFVFALSAIILYKAGYYGDRASVIVFGFTSVIVLIIVVSLIRWVSQLANLSSLNYALSQGESTAHDVFDALRKTPHLGCRGLDFAPSKTEGQPVLALTSGYVTGYDFKAIQDYAEENDLKVILLRRPGDTVLEASPLARVVGECEPERIAAWASIGQNRTYSQDPRYALQALREAASKALSPGINDVGTAVDVVNRLERVLWSALRNLEDKDPTYDRIYLEKIDPRRYIDLSFRAIARDGAAYVEVLVRTAQAVDHIAAETGMDPTETLKEIDAAAEAGLATSLELDRYREVRDRLG